jgi:predicted NUDIX family phosphoesterase
VATPDELVLVLPRDEVPGGLDWRGVEPRPFAPVLEAVKQSGAFRPRGKIEDDPSLKQIIPYLLLRDGERIFLMKRTSAGGDERLHERYSIGVGGHVNPGDADVLGGLNREWREEIDADFVPEFKPLGLLNDDSNPVGAVHLGLVYAADAAGRPVAIRETHKLSGEFVTMDAVGQVQDRLETWSALLFDFLSVS